MTINGDYINIDLNDRRFRQPIQEKFGVEFTAIIGQNGNNTGIRFQCSMPELSAAVFVWGLKTDNPGHNHRGEYDPKDIDDLKNRLNTAEFWDPIKAEVQQQHNERMAAEYVELLQKAISALGAIRYQPRDEERLVELTIKVVVKAEHAADLLLIPADIIGTTTRSLDRTIELWRRYKNLGFTDEQAGALALSKVGEDEAESLRLWKSEK